jgi:endonuclease G
MALNKISNPETFYMTNMSPRTPSFNIGIWLSVEAWLIDFALLKDGLHVVTGPILFGSCGVISGGIVPCSFYKNALKCGSNPKLIGFILSNSRTSIPVRRFAISIDEMKKRTGINFFPQLVDGVENQILYVVNYSGWNL